MRKLEFWGITWLPVPAYIVAYRVKDGRTMTGYKAITRRVAFDAIVWC